MKTVSIMTWYSYENYGSVLQAVALNRVISDLGYKAVDIAYDPSFGRATHEGARLSFASKVIRKIANNARGIFPANSIDKSQLFNSFVSRFLTLTDDLESKEALSLFSNCFDAYVCGSDQIWSPRCFDSSYYLDFVGDSQRMVAYAPSFGCDSLEPFSSGDQIASLLRRFNSIGVREASAVDIVERCTGRKPLVVLDPTLLLDGKEWERFATQISENEPYCLIYLLGSDNCNLKCAQEIARANGLRPVLVPVFKRDQKLDYCARFPIGPAEFLSLVSHANLVCTDSFHGMVFSTIFQKDFIAFERFDPNSSDSQNTRVYSFLEMAGAEDALLPRHELSEWEKHVGGSLDYSYINRRIEAKRSESIGYLRSALARATADRAGDH